MKTLILFLFALSLGNVSGTNPCSLKGKVRFVESHADYKIYVTDQFPDVDVQLVKDFPNKPGKWKAVQAHEDFTVQIVTNMANADFKVRFVELWPRCRRK